jgi:hypothetical protein
MGHNICALISRNTIDENVIKKFQLAVAFEDEFAIVILDMDSIFYWSNKLNLSCKSLNDKIDWACELVFYFAKELKMDNYALIQTDYFAGIGEQYASFYENGNLIIENESINNVLKKLGVKRKNSFDEFDTLNLKEYHATENFYWDSYNFADKRSNMIAGRIPK